MKRTDGVTCMAVSFSGTGGSVAAARSASALVLSEWPYEPFVRFWKYPRPVSDNMV